MKRLLRISILILALLAGGCAVKPTVSRLRAAQANPSRDVAAAVEQAQGGSLRLNGTYRIRQPVSFDGLKAVLCEPGTWIKYIGPRTDEPVIELGSCGWVEHLNVACYYNAKGIHGRDFKYGERLTDVRVHEPNGYGVFLERCWGAEIDGLWVDAPDGVALKLDEHNGGWVRGLIVEREYREWSGPVAEVNGSSGRYTDWLIGAAYNPDGAAVEVTGSCKTFQNIRFEGGDHGTIVRYGIRFRPDRTGKTTGHVVRGFHAETMDGSGLEAAVKVVPGKNGTSVSASGVSIPGGTWKGRASGNGVVLDGAEDAGGNYGGPGRWKLPVMRTED
mgnify:CR=1 FL=1